MSEQDKLYVDGVEGRSHLVSVDGVRLHYVEVDGPDDAPPVIFTHGGGPGSTGWSNFRLSAKAFSARHRCHFLDFAQYGKSDMVVVDGPVFTWHAKKLLGFMDGLGIAKAHLVNQSFGGCVATALAAAHGERITSLTMIGSQPVGHGVIAPLPLTTKHARDIFPAYFGGDGPSPEKMRALIARLEFHDDSKVDAENVRLRHEASINPAYLELIRTPGFFGQPDDLTALLPRVAVPTMIFWGLHDWFGGIDVPMMMLNRFADARLHVIGNAAHHLQTECPAEFNAAALAFIEGYTA